MLKVDFPIVKLVAVLTSYWVVISYKAFSEGKKQQKPKLKCQI